MSGLSKRIAVVRVPSIVRQSPIRILYANRVSRRRKEEMLPLLNILIDEDDTKITKKGNTVGSPYTETNKHWKDDIKYCMYVQTVQQIRQTIIFIIQFKSNLYFRLYPLYKVKGGPYKTHIKYIIIKV